MHGDYAKQRVGRLRKLMAEGGVEAVMIRNIFSFHYFTGVAWWQPALLIPLSGEPIIFAFEDEVKELGEKTWIRNIKGYRKVEDLIRSVVTSIRDTGASVLGFDVDIDQSALLYEQFKAMHAGKKILNVHPMIMQLRMVKDEHEISHIEKASQIAEKAIDSALGAVKLGATELEVAAEAEYRAIRLGADSIHVYVNSGRPRIHAHPRNVKIRSNDTVMIDVMPSYEGYFADLAHTVFVGTPNEEQKRAYGAFLEANNIGVEKLKLGLKLKDLESEVYEIYKRHGLEKHYVYGFFHGVGLRFEEDPITTILVQERAAEVLENMVLNVGHSPLSGDGIGTIKMEDTVLITEKGAERLTKMKRDTSP
jgi:Xaa-Pro aminopeptidase